VERLKKFRRGAWNWTSPTSAEPVVEDQARVNGFSSLWRTTAGRTNFPKRRKAKRVVSSVERRARSDVGVERQQRRDDRIVGRGWDCQVHELIQFGGGVGHGREKGRSPVIERYSSLQRVQ
jgi:hypothetical protein